MYIITDAPKQFTSKKTLLLVIYCLFSLSVFSVGLVTIGPRAGEK